MTENEIHRVALHEASHFIAAGHFRIPAFPVITLDGKCFPGSTMTQAGICELQDPVTLYQGCVVGWSGILAECLFCETLPEFAPPFRPSAKDLPSWHSMM